MAKTSMPSHEPATSIRANLINKEDNRIGEYPSHLRGFATNRYGGNNLQHEEGLRGGTYGPAGPVRIYTAAELKEYERVLQQQGSL